MGNKGRKAAKLFTIHERGKCRKTYYRRKQIWTKLEALIRRGHDFGTACDFLYRQYGEKSSVTTIIDKILEEKRREKENG
jgi:hypothetical protein